MKDFVQWASQPRVRHGLQIALGLLLVWAAVSKIANPTKFLGDVLAYQVPLPRVIFRFVAAVLPWIELLCGLLLMAGSWLEAALGLASGLFGTFFFATGQAWFRGLKISCGCFDLKLLGFSADSTFVHFLESPGFAFFRNLFLVSLALWLQGRLATGAARNLDAESKSFTNKALDTAVPSSKKGGGARRR